MTGKIDPERFLNRSRTFSKTFPMVFENVRDRFFLLIFSFSLPDKMAVCFVVFSPLYLYIFEKMINIAVY